MLEIPEAYTIAQQLNEVAKGKVIERVLVDNDSHKFAFFEGEPETYDSKLAGKVWGEATSHGGLIEAEIGEFKLSFAEGVNIRFLEAGKPAPKKCVLQIEFSDGTSIVCTVQMYGCIRLLLEGESDNFYYLVQKEKPSPLTDEFSRAYFQGIVDDAKPTLSAKGLLTTEQRIPGLGNGVNHDILYNARIHPKKKVSTMTKEQVDDLFASVKTTLAEMVAGGGRDTDKDLFGEPGRYQTILSSKTVKAPCPTCGGALDRKAYLGGNIYYCSRCQDE
ncbi:MAG: endonuclease VIII [Coriobacteriia bacterium]|nr:endonuclease VIII [Coriobacteriia bacterium]